MERLFNQIDEHYNNWLKRKGETKEDVQKQISLFEIKEENIKETPEGNKVLDITSDKIQAMINEIRNLLREDKTLLFPNTIRVVARIEKEIQGGAVATEEQFTLISKYLQKTKEKYQERSRELTREEVQKIFEALIPTLKEPEGVVNDWTLNFLRDVYKKHIANEKLSEKQSYILIKVHEDVTAKTKKVNN